MADRKRRPSKLGLESPLGLQAFGQEDKTVFRFAGQKTQWFALAVLLLGTLAGAGNPRPAWTVDLEKQGLRGFHTQINLTWTKQQNVIFLPSGRLIVYQVNQLAEPARLAARNAAGGGGNFFLEIRAFDAHDGRLIQSLRLPTSGVFSSMLPTQGGKLVIRTGETLLLCTQDFKTLTSRDLPLKGEAPVELWQMGISPSGGQIALVFEQAKPSPSFLTDEKAVSEVEILDAGTLKTIKQFSIPSRISPWSVGEGFLVTADPGHVTGELRFGLLDFEGNWSPLRLEGDSCNDRLLALSDGTLAAYGCGRLAVVNTNGAKLFTRDFGSHGQVGSAIRSGHYLAVELDRRTQIIIPGTNFPLTIPKPERLEVYDLTAKKRLLSFSVKSDNLYYAISENGELAVIEGTTLTLYRMEN